MFEVHPHLHILTYAPNSWIAEGLYWPNHLANFLVPSSAALLSPSIHKQVFLYPYSLNFYLFYVLFSQLGCRYMQVQFNKYILKHKKKPDSDFLKQWNGFIGLSNSSPEVAQISYVV